MINKINDHVSMYENWFVEIRRDIHRQPEPSTCEYKTSEKVRAELENMGVEVESYYKTGIAGIIRGEKEGRTIGLRFDMDALEMEEKTGLSYSSEVAGMMHSCGHDGHTAMGLGAARVLMEIKEQLKGNIKLIFQPAEEDSPNGGGAQFMIDEGVLDDSPGVDAILGIHIWPDLEKGKIGSKEGPIMAASDPFSIEIMGKGVHASQPYLGIDPIVIGSQIVNNLQTIVSRNVDPFEQAVLSIGVFNGGTRYNVIPDKVMIKGTVRTFNEEIRKEIAKRIKTIAISTAAGMGGEAQVDYKYSYPPLINDDAVVAEAKTAAVEMLGPDSFVEVGKPAPTGEDFAFFARKVPAAFLWLGCKKEGEETEKLHSPYFTFDESILADGVRVLVKTAVNWLENHS